MGRNTRILIGFLAFANMFVAMSTGFLMPNFWIAVVCIATLFVRPVLRQWRAHRLEFIWNLGDDGRGPAIERV